ncbi:Hypothetical_protein [Hexamita inflata]|uniref:Hypothetical_protein n=1 Tax=Hexamita inflata TaxID=28002 RepID=A0AA86URZ9_9EUKA|nr:Hypothetical protein HINF_LOCUS57015 [Hexamita inflata]
MFNIVKYEQITIAVTTKTINFLLEHEQNQNNDAYKKNWKKHSWNQADVVQKLTKVLQKTLKQQGNYFDRNNNKFNNNKGKLLNSLNEYRYNDVKSKRNNDSFMYIKIPIGLTNFGKQNQGGNKSFGGYKQGNFTKIHMRSQATDILTQQLLSEPAP